MANLLELLTPSKSKSVPISERQCYGDNTTHGPRVQRGPSRESRQDTCRCEGSNLAARLLIGTVSATRESLFSLHVYILSASIYIPLTPIRFPIVPLSYHLLTNNITIDIFLMMCIDVVSMLYVYV